MEKSKILLRFWQKIFSRSQKDNNEDLPNKINVDLLAIFGRKSFNQNIHKIFSSKNLRKKFNEDLVKIFIKVHSEISFFRRFQKRLKNFFKLIHSSKNIFRNNQTSQQNKSYIAKTK
jgi:hypothetical protein